jgi:hypothetical protein
MREFTGNPAAHARIFVSEAQLVPAHETVRLPPSRFALRWPGKPDTTTTASDRIRSQRMKVLVIDVGGTHVKLQSTGHRAVVKIPSGPHMTPKQMVRMVQNAVDGWEYDVVSIGYPGPVVRGQPQREPKNLGGGWVRFNFQ